MRVTGTGRQGVPSSNGHANAKKRSGMMIEKILAAGALAASVPFLAPQASAQIHSPNGSSR